jgi:branched-chain amino acid transport system ATP-binding protein
MVEQRVDLATRFCDRVYVLVGGEVVLEDTPDAIDANGRALIETYLG